MLDVSETGSRVVVAVVCLLSSGVAIAMWLDVGVHRRYSFHLAFNALFSFLYGWAMMSLAHVWWPPIGPRAWAIESLNTFAAAAGAGWVMLTVRVWAEARRGP